MRPQSWALVAIALLVVLRGAVFGRRPHAINCSHRLERRFGYRGPVCLGPFSLANRAGAIELRGLWLLLGRPTLPRNSDTVCYRDERAGRYLIVERGADDRRLVRGLTLSQINVCPAGGVYKASGFATWATGEGLRLGSSAAEVLSKYGKPSSVWSSRAGRGFTPYPAGRGRDQMAGTENILVYLPRHGAPDTSHAFFGVRNGVVVWMTVSDNE